MEYRTLGRTGLKVSVLGLGGLEVGRPWGIPDKDDPGLPPDEESANSFLNHVLDQGVNFIDTAAAYWASEERIGNAISHRRDEYVLATKWGEWCDENGSVYDYSPGAMWQFLESSLRKLKTDVIDLYQIHSARMDVLQSEDALTEMIKAKEQGKIRYIGCSCGEQEAVAAIESGGFDTVQVSYSLLDRQMEDRVFPMAIENNIGVIIMGGLAYGRLTDKYQRLKESEPDTVAKVSTLDQEARSMGMTLSEMSLRFVFAHPAVRSVIAGTRTKEHLDSNLTAADGFALTKIQTDRIRKLL